MDEINQEILEESARLYAEIYFEDGELQELTDGAIADFQDELEWDMLFENAKAQHDKVTERSKDNIMAGKPEKGWDSF